jgi:hypothetical protein
LENLWLSGDYGGIMMHKNIFKALGVFTLALFVMSMTGAAVKCTPCKANADTFSLSLSKDYGNVLKNDVGSGIKIAGMSKTANGGKVTMYSKGDFYYKPASSSRTTVRDSFTYTIVNKCGQKSTAKVIINYKYSTKNSTDSQGTHANGSIVEVTVHPHEGNMYWVGANGHQISLINNNSAVNPTYSQLLSFIKNDKTDQQKYIPGKYTCGDFAETVHNNAEKVGYKAGWVTIDGVDHCCNVFQTSDKGTIYIDCTGSPNGGGSWDSSVKLANGNKYQRIPLFSNNFYFNSMGIVSSYKAYW